MNIKRALAPPAKGKVTSQAKIIVRKSVQSTFFPLCSSGFIQPTKTTLPTMQCVLEIGMPNLLAIRTVVAELVSTVKPLENESLYK